MVGKSPYGGYFDLETAAEHWVVPAKRKRLHLVDEASFVRSARSLQGTIDRTEDIPNLRSEPAEDGNHNDCHEHQDDRVLDQSLPLFLWME